MTKKLLCLGSLLALSVLSVHAADKKEAVDTSKLPPASDQKGVTYAKDIKPIFEKSCVKCHGAEKPKAKLRLDSLEGALKGSENGPVIVAGKPDESRLYKLVNQPKSSEDRMPPEGDPLKKEQIATIEKWIKEGAKWPDGVALKWHNENVFEHDAA